MIEIDKERLGVTKNYISSSLKQGFEIKDIKKKLTEHGYSKDLINQAITDLAIEKTEKRFFKGSKGSTKELIVTNAVVICIIVIFTGLFYFYIVGFSDQFFLFSARHCLNAYHHTDIGETVIRYNTTDCDFGRKITAVDENEPDDVEALFEDLSMTCRFGEEVDISNFDYISKNIHKCEGPLKDVILDLKRSV